MVRAHGPHSPKPPSLGLRPPPVSSRTSPISVSNTPSSSSSSSPARSPTSLSSLHLAAWFFLFFSCHEHLSVAGFLVVVVALGLASLVAVVMTGVWWNVAVSLLVRALVVCWHTVVRSMDDLVIYYRQSPYDRLMSNDHDPQGNSLQKTNQRQSWNKESSVRLQLQIFAAKFSSLS